ncbi:MAG TPA: hypothetical protein VFI47_25285 [Acidimicrobiales bacterium]|nr:hypothetical protein [Acidimicrobiales bacterium]
MTYPERVRQGEGWLLFAAVVLVTAGIMRVLDALWAFDKDDEIPERLQVLVWDDNLAAYGWLWLIVGVLLIAAGFGVLSGASWARWFGIVMAALSGITAFLWIYAYPIWALVGSLIAFLVIYALATYGGREAGDVT